MPHVSLGWHVIELRWLPLVFLVGMTTRAAVPTFTVTEIPPLPGHEENTARGINNHGDVVRFSYVTNSNREQVGTAFLWSRGVLTDLGTLDGLTTRAEAVNDSGVVVGWTTFDDRRAFRWSKGKMEALPTLGGDNAAAFDINNAGHIVGWAEAVSGSGSRGAVLWADGTVEDLECGWRAGKVNGVGSVVGQAIEGFEYAFLWDGTCVRLDEFFDAVDLNDDGIIVGRRLFTLRAAFLASGEVVELQAPDEISDPSVRAINNSDDIVGIGFRPLHSIALLWIDLGPRSYDLNVLAGPRRPVSLRRAWNINEQGQIVGDMADHKGRTRAFRLDPIDPDIDHDTYVDLADYARLEACWSGPVHPVGPACEASDLTRDGHVDLLDYRSLELGFAPGL